MPWLVLKLRGLSVVVVSCLRFGLESCRVELVSLRVASLEKEASRSWGVALEAVDPE